MRPGALAHRALAGHDLAHAVGDVLARHLDQAERRDLDDVDLAAVLLQLALQDLEHGVAVLLARHVDEVDDDDAADVAQAQLADDLDGCFEVVLEDRVLELLGRAGEAPGVDVDDREGLAVVEHERAAGGQRHAAGERRADALLDLVALEERALALVELDALGELGRRAPHVGHDAVILALVVDHELGDVGAEVVAHHLQREVGLGVDERRRVRALRMAAADVPQLLEQADVALELVERRALRGGARDQSAVLLRLHLLEQVAQAVALVALELLGDADAVAAGRQHHEAAGQRHVHREAGALRAHRVLRDLDEHVLAGLDQLLDALGAALAVVQLGEDDLGDVEEAVLREPDVDEGRLHAGQDGVDPSLVDVADDRAAAPPLDVRLR